MTKNNPTTQICLGFILALASLCACAGQVYLYTDDSGIKTMSKTLPPHASQHGYDVLDDSSLRVLERVAPAPTKAEIAELDRQKTAEKERTRLAEIKIIEDKKRLHQAMLYDANLKASYRTEDELFEKRQSDQLYFQNQIDEKEMSLKRNTERLHQFQQQAAKIELSGRVVSDNLQKRLKAVAQEINNNRTDLTHLMAEKEKSIQQYAKDLIRLRVLLDKTQAKL